MFPTPKNCIKMYPPSDVPIVGIQAQADVR